MNRATRRRLDATQAEAAADVLERLNAARAMTSAADGKAGQLLTATGVLLTAGGVVAGTADLTPVTAGLTATAGAALGASLLLLLWVLTPRGDAPTAWLLPTGHLNRLDELQAVAQIVTRKHQALRRATGALAAAVALGAAAVVAALIGGAL